MAKRIGMILAAMLAAPLAAQAADLAIPSVTWQGCSVGVNMGGVHSKMRAVDQIYTEGTFAGAAAWNAAGDTLSSADTGFSGGLQFGCDMQQATDGPSLVFGIIGDVALSTASGSATSSVSSDTQMSYDANVLATQRAKLGLADGNALFYVTGGVAEGNFSLHAYDLAAAPSPGMMDVSTKSTELGWVAGAGMAWAMSERTSLSLEYLHMDFGKATATGEALNVPGAFPRFDGDLRVDTLRVGVNWKL